MIPLHHRRGSPWSGDRSGTAWACVGVLVVLVPKPPQVTLRPLLTDSPLPTDAGIRESLRSDTPCPMFLALSDELGSHLEWTTWARSLWMRHLEGNGYAYHETHRA